MIGEKDVELDAVREELRKLSETCQTTRTEAEEAADRLRTSEEERTSLEKRLNTSETVISWLNRQLTQAQKRDPGLRLTAPPEGLATFTSSPATVSGANSRREDSVDKEK